MIQIRLKEELLAASVVVWSSVWKEYPKANIIKACWQHGLAFTIFLYWPLLLISHIDSIQYPHRGDECKFSLVGQHLWVIELESIEECCLWVHSIFSSSAKMFCPFWMVCTAAVFLEFCFQDLFKTASLRHSNPTCSPGILLKSKM